VSNYLAIATVTETLRQLLQTAVSNAAPGVQCDATAVRPAATLGTDPSGAGVGVVNIFLYQVTPNAAGRNLDLPHRNGNGNFARRPRVAFDLHYLLSFYGPDIGLVTHRLLGRVVQTLHAHPVLSRQKIRSVTNTTPPNFLSDSDLADEVELVKFTPLALSLEELARLWSIFFQTTYALSVAYQATVVFIEGEEAPSQPLPVRQREIQAIPFSRPVIDSLSPQIAEAGELFVLRGTSFASDHVRVQFGATSVAPAVVANDRIEVNVPAGLTPGVHTVQVVHLLHFKSDPPNTLRRMFESNVAAFVLAPALKLPPAPFAEPVFGSITRGQPLMLEVKPPVSREQEIQLLLGSRTIALPPRLPSQPATATQFSFTIPSDFPTGEYFVRVGVEGAQSQPLRDDTNRYTGPKIKIVGGAKSLRSSAITLAATADTLGGQVTITDENAIAAEKSAVAIRWTIPNGVTFDDVQNTDATGVARFTVGSNLAGTYALTVTQITLEGSAFDQLGSLELTKSITK